MRIWSVAQDATEKRHYQAAKIGDHILDIFILPGSGNAGSWVSAGRVTAESVIVLRPISNLE